MSLALIINITNYLKYSSFWDCDGIDNVTLRLWKFSDFFSRHTVGVVGDDIIFHILVRTWDCSVCVILDIHRSSSDEGIWLVRSVLQWCHNKHDGISNHWHHDCLLNHLLRGISKKTPELHITGLCEGNSLVAGELPAQRASNMENVSIWWRHHGNFIEKFCWTTSQREMAGKLTNMEFSVKITILFQQIVSNRLSSNHVILYNVIENIWARWMLHFFQLAHG